MRNRLSNRHPVVARIPARAYLAIHRWCAEHDVGGGSSPDHIYDAPTGGAINVWSLPWDTPERRKASELRGTYYPEREDGLYPGEVLETNLRAFAEGRLPRGLHDPTGLSGGEEILPSRTCLVLWDPGPKPEHAWHPEEARRHLAALYQRVTGEPMPGD
jgi:hypothetical protein